MSHQLLRYQSGIEMEKPGYYTASVTKVYTETIDGVQHCKSDTVWSASGISGYGMALVAASEALEKVRAA